jgi:hypothetical protein
MSQLLEGKVAVIISGGQDIAQEFVEQGHPLL